MTTVSAEVLIGIGHPDDYPTYEISGYNTSPPSLATCIGDCKANSECYSVYYKDKYNNGGTTGIGWCRLLKFGSDLLVRSSNTDYKTYIVNAELIGNGYTNDYATYGI